MNFKLLYKLVFVLAIIIIIKIAYDKLTSYSFEKFYNIYPTELIDNKYININEDPYDYKLKLRVGDNHGVDLNCNNVSKDDIIAWIRDNNPDVLHQYVYLYDPSIDINNPVYAPRVLKMLLRNLPAQHPYIPIITKCFPYQVRIA